MAAKIIPIQTNEHPLGLPEKYNATFTGSDVAVIPHRKGEILVSVENVDPREFDNAEIARMISLKTFVETFGPGCIVDYIISMEANKILK